MRVVHGCLAGLALLTAVPVMRGNDVSGKLRSLVLPSIEFREVPLRDALTYLQARSRELDPEGNGINILLDSGKAAETEITLELRHVTLGRALWFVARLSGLEVRVDPHAAMLVPAKPGEKGRPSGKADPEIAAKVNRIIVPSVEFTDTPFEDALDFLREFSVQLDTAEPDPAKRGINLVRIPRRPAAGGEAGDEEPRVTLSLTNVPLAEAIRYTCDLARHEIRVEKGAVVVYPAPVKTAGP